MKYKHFFSKRAGWLYVPTVRNFAGFILIKKTPQKLIVVCCLCCWKAPKFQGELQLGEGEPMELESFGLLAGGRAPLCLSCVTSH